MLINVAESFIYYLQVWQSIISQAGTYPAILCCSSGNWGSQSRSQQWVLDFEVEYEEVLEYDEYKPIL